MTGASAQILWWRDQTPFGQTVAAGGFSQTPLRFPGQFADPESGLAYNYFRDYDPALGRYIQSDPIGLRGGLNTYGYVHGNPLRYVDPTGEFIQLAPPVIGAIARKYGGDVIVGAAVVAGIDYLCDGTVTAEGVLLGAVLGPVGRVFGSRAWTLGARYLPGMGWAVEAVGRGVGAAVGRLGGRSSGQISNAAGVVRDFTLEVDQTFYRVYSGAMTEGKYLAAIKPRSSARAQEALALPRSNAATHVQEVHVPAGTRLRRSRAAPMSANDVFPKRRGGAEQFELLSVIPSKSFGPGSPLP